jgi:gamma-glutamyltranspeptidase/glutathione hydrolase
VTSGHYLATAAGLRILEQGGNAIDAAAAMGFCLALLEPQLNGIGGEVPVLIYSAKERKCFAVCGLGWSPKALTISYFRDQGLDLIPYDGYLPATTPAVVDTWAVALARFGSMGFSQVLQPAIELAEGGYPVHPELHQFLQVNARRIAERYPTTARIYYPGGQVPVTGELLRNPDWANTLRRLCAAEQAAGAGGRAAGLAAARRVFYTGEIAERIVSFVSTSPVVDTTGTARRALLGYEDLAEWHAAVEEPLTFTYRGLDVHKCSAWTQGPVFLQQLALLEGFDLRAMGHNSPEYLHVLIECAKLAFADREAYYGDPLFDAVPLDVLLSKEYAARRRALIGPEASTEQRPGDVGRVVPSYALREVQADNQQALGITGERPQAARLVYLGDTTHLDAADRAGNLVAATPSGGWIGSSPVIEGLGFSLGTRGQMFYLNPDRPNALAPRKRPRATLTPSLVTRGGEPLLAFGTPGGDAQDQWTLQFFLNLVEFGMDLQQALEAPTVHSLHCASSFYPRAARPGLMEAEGRVPREVLAALERRGHTVQVVEPWINGKATAVRIDKEQGVLLGGASPRYQIGYALGW